VIKASAVSWGSFEDHLGYIAQPETPASASPGIDGAFALSTGVAIAAIALNLY
jgi:hypothetical protein